VENSAAVRGFTLVELCCVIVIAGVLGALAGPRILDSSPAFNQRGYTDELGAALRTAGEVALANGCGVQVTITPGAGFSAMQPVLGPGNSCTASYSVPVLQADGTALSAQPPRNADVTAAATLTFNSNGTVAGPANIVVAGMPAGFTTPLTIQVDPQSGFVTLP